MAAYIAVRGIDPTDRAPWPFRRRQYRPRTDRITPLTQSLPHAAYRIKRGLKQIDIQKTGIRQIGIFCLRQRRKGQRLSLIHI